MYIKVRAIPGSKKEKVVEVSEDHYDIWVREKAEHNHANRRIVEIMRTKFAGRAVRMISGHHSPGKIISIDD